MFNFDTDVVINSQEVIDGMKDMSNGNLIVIPRIGNYKVANILTRHSDPDADATAGKMVKIAAAASKCGSCEIELPALAEADTTTGKLAEEALRILVKISCSEKYGEFALANWHSFEKPVMIEISKEVLDDENAAKKIQAICEAVIDADVASVAVAGKKITISLKECIFDIKAENVKVYGLRPVNNETGIDGYFDYIERDTKVDPVIVASIEGQGTYAQIISNLRFPTHENVRFASPNEDEMPIKGAVYDQYSLDLVVKRENPAGGLSAAGQVITSKTHHNFFVLAGKAKSDGTIDTACTLNVTGTAFADAVAD